MDDGRGDDDPLNLIVEIKGYRGEDAKDKANTMDAYWVPGVNNLGTLRPLGVRGVHGTVYEIEARIRHAGRWRRRPNAPCAHEVTCFAAPPARLRRPRRPLEMRSPRPGAAGSMAKPPWKPGDPRMPSSI